MLVGGDAGCHLDGERAYAQALLTPHTLPCCRVSPLTFILLCLMPSTICSICLKNWSRAAGEAMALKEKSAEVGRARGAVRKGVGDSKESALYLECATIVN